MRLEVAQECLSIFPHSAKELVEVLQLLFCSSSVLDGGGRSLKRISLSKAKATSRLFSSVATLSFKFLAQAILAWKPHRRCLVFGIAWLQQIVRKYQVVMS
jgi:hypothetical protein